MSEDEKGPGMTIRIPAPRVLAEAAAPSLDPRTAEVLRSLDRAKGTIARMEVPTASRSVANLALELRALREGLSQTTPNIEASAQSLDSTARAVERVIAVAGERLADFQRGQEGAVSELRVSVARLIRQADALAAWRAWWARQVATWAVVLALVLAAEIALAWRAHAVAQSTYDILQQILENQTKAQAAKGGKRR
jgi:hypothetical protein